MADRRLDTDLDAELTRRVEAQARIADSLVELERHLGHRLRAGAALTGASAHRTVVAGGRARARRAGGPTATARSRATASATPAAAPRHPSHRRPRRSAAL